MLRVGDANDIERIEHALRSLSGKRRAGPRSSFSTATSATVLRISRTRPKRTASRWARKRCGSRNALWLAGGCEISGARRRVRAFAGRHREARRGGPPQNGTSISPPTRQIPELATEIDQMQRRELPAGWDRNLPSFPADPKGVAGRDASGKVLNVLAQNIPWLIGGSADLGAVEQDAAQVRRRGRLPGRAIRAAETCTSAFASTRWRRLSTDCRCRKSGPSARPFSSSATTRGPPFGCPR